jgi:hypothetical protein
MDEAVSKTQIPTHVYKSLVCRFGGLFHGRRGVRKKGVFRHPLVEPLVEGVVAPCPVHKRQIMEEDKQACGCVLGFWLRGGEDGWGIHDRVQHVFLVCLSLFSSGFSLHV